MEEDFFSHPVAVTQTQFPWKSTALQVARWTVHHFQTSLEDDCIHCAVFGHLHAVQLVAKHLCHVFSGISFVCVWSI